MKVALDEPVIYNFFNRESDKAPIDEFEYVLDNDVVRSFVDEITDKIQLATVTAQRKNIKMHLTDITRSNQTFQIHVAAWASCKEKDKEKARQYLERALFALREVYEIADRVLTIN